jgi:ribonuclease P protein component
VLARSHRLTSSVGFSAAVRGGRRAGSRSVVVHLALPDPEVAAERGARVGFVVGKVVGNAVTRNRVKRRLRHLVRARVESLPGSAVLVVRALPAAATATFEQLGKDLDRALGRVLGMSASGPGQQDLVAGPGRR